MRKVRLPDTDLLVSRLSFGTARLHHLARSRERRGLLAAAVDLGFSHFDTAPYYGLGLAEHELGSMAASVRDRMTVATKVGLYPPAGMASHSFGVWWRKGLGKVVSKYSRPEVDWSLGRAGRSLEGSLKRLRRECVDILFLHEPDLALIEREECLRWLEEQKRLGKLRYWGLAGNPQSFAQWIADRDGLGRILQVSDRIGAQAPHPVVANGRSFQITFGYLAEFARCGEGIKAEQVIRAALTKNETGSVLCSTRRTENLSALSAAAEL